MLTILFSVLLAGMNQLPASFTPQKAQFLWAGVAASVIGFAGNEIVAVFRIRVGRRDQQRGLDRRWPPCPDRRPDESGGFFGALGVYLGFPLADPLVGLAITVVILRIV